VNDRQRYLIGQPPDGEVLRAFCAASNDVEVIIGPLGSGKTHTTIEKIFKRFNYQPPDANGLRRSRWAAIRNTYPDLRGTTIRDWCEIMPDHLGQFKDTQPPVWRGAWRLKDGTKVRAELIFLAMDRPQDEKKLRGYQFTGVWCNELKELPQRIFQMAFSRTGRYPASADVPQYWSGLIGDTNSPDEDHWLYKLAEDDKPANVSVFRQPGGVILDPVNRTFRPNPRAENLKHLKGGIAYYSRQLELNRDRFDWVNVNLANNYGSVVDGKPVYPEFDDHLHVLSDDSAFEYVPGKTLHIGADFGRTPAATWGQRDQWGRMRTIGELVTDNMGAVAFGKLLRRTIINECGREALNDYVGTGDPAGTAMTQVDDTTPFDALEEAGLTFWPALTNDPMQRREAVARGLTSLTNGQPDLMINAQCKVLRQGMRGRFCYRRIQVAGDERYHDKRDKNAFSHVCEAHEYMLLGAGEGDFRDAGGVDSDDWLTSQLPDDHKGWRPNLDL
jgi:hypothetical protein